MEFDLRRPCDSCPFKTDSREGWLGQERAEEIADGLMRGETFSCHKTNDYVDGEAVETSKTKHCAGATIMLEKLEQPNQMMRVAERLGFYDRTKLKMDSPVFEDEDEFIEHHT